MSAARAERPPKPPQKVRWTRRALAALTGALIVFSFPFSTEPDSNLWPLGWFAFVPFLWALEGTGRWQAFRIGWLAGFVTNFGGFWWISVVLEEFGHLPEVVSWPGSALFGAYQGLVFAAFAVLYRSLARPRDGQAMAAPVNLFIVAALYTAVEFVFPLLFPWFMGNGQYRFSAFIQLADLTGVMGLTFVMVAVSTALYQLLLAKRRRLAAPWRTVGGAGALLAATLIYGVIRLGMVDAAIAEAPTLTLGLVEADIGIFDKQAGHLEARERALVRHRNLLRHQLMSAEIAAAHADLDLIVWPESSYLPLDDAFAKRSDRFAVAVTAQGGLAYLRDAGPADGDAFTWHLDGSSDADGAPRLLAVAAEREDAWVAVGEGGAVRAAVRESGPARELTPTVVASGTTQHLRAAAVAVRSGHRPQADGAAVQVWAVGDRGTVVRGPLPAGPLTALQSPTVGTLRAVAALGTRRAIAVGDGGALVEVVGREVKAADLGGATPDFRAVAATSGNAAVAVGRGGAVWVRRAADKKGAPTWHDDNATISADLVGVVLIGGQAVAASAESLYFRQGELQGRGTWRPDPAPAELGPLVGLGRDALERLLVWDAAGRVAVRAMDRRAEWRVTMLPGEASLRAVAPLDYVQVLPLPRDIRYVWKSPEPLPALAAYDAQPMDEFTGPSPRHARDRHVPQRGFDTPLLFGGITWEPNTAPDAPLPRAKYNTAILLDAQGRIRGTYDKNYLLAFGEYMPFGDLFPELYDMFRNAGRFTPGQEVRVFDWGPHKIGVMVCYEDILPQFVGRLADKSPNVIINVTNDAWFGRTAEPHHHLALSTFRSVETRLALVRSTNTGVSAVVDPAGRIVAQTRIDDPEVLVHAVPLMDGGTVYTAVGDLFAYAALAYVFGLFGWRWWRRRRAAQAAPIPDAEVSA